MIKDSIYPTDSDAMVDEIITTIRRGVEIGLAKFALMSLPVRNFIVVADFLSGKSMRQVAEDARLTESEVGAILDASLAMLKAFTGAGANE